MGRGPVNFGGGVRFRGGLPFLGALGQTARTNGFCGTEILTLGRARKFIRRLRAVP